jgi:hypothetical protein
MLHLVASITASISNLNLQHHSLIPSVIKPSPGGQPSDMLTQPKARVRFVTKLGGELTPYDPAN